MKKIMNKINFAVVAMMASAASAFAANSRFNVNSSGLCDLIDQLYEVFKLLRTLAFVGAAFIIAGWAWTYISKAGDDKAGPSLEDAKKKGTGLLVGFGLFFMIGVVLTFITSTVGQETIGCVDRFNRW